MLKNQKRLLHAILIAIFLLVSFYFLRELLWPKVKVGEHLVPINPNAELKEGQIYRLRFWDYDLPLQLADKSYHDYITGLIEKFTKANPQIKVEVSFLNLADGSARLKEALRKGEQPDLYCSAFERPEFDYRYQVPIGPYLTELEQQSYLLAARELASVSGIQCMLPRWIGVGLWLGNSKLLAQLGLSVNKIQAQGWNWEELQQASQKLTKQQFLLGGNLGQPGILKELTASVAGTVGCATNEKPSDLARAFLEELLKEKKSLALEDPNLLGNFFEGKVALVGGMRPIFYRLIKERLTERKADWQLVWLPVPSRYAERNAMIAETSMIAVYRTRPILDEQVTAAMKLAKYLGAAPEIKVWQKLMVIPAHQRPLTAWLKDQQRLGNDCAWMLKWLQGTPIWHESCFD